MAEPARAFQDHETPDHLRSVDSPAHRAKFAATDHRVARVLGPQRASAHIYGYLASAWYEFASPDALKSIGDKLKRAKTPGDWVDVTYAELMTFAGTRAKASIIRWIRVLAEERHECPWGRCAEEHPLVVVRRVGRSRPNRYRRWKCGEDTLVVRQRVRSAKLQAIARARVTAGEFLNGHPPTPDGVKSYHETSRMDVPLPLDISDGPDVKSYNETSRNGTSGSLEVSHTIEVKSHDKTSRSLMVRPSEVSRQDLQKSHGKTYLRVNSSNSLKTTAKNPDHAAAVEKSDEVDAVACEVVDEIVALAQRVEASYRDDQAWAVARRLAPVAISLANGNSAGARRLLLAAIADRRIARASNPVGLLIRGIIGDEQGNDRFLMRSTSAAPSGSTSPAAAPPKIGTEIPPGLKSALLDALRSGHAITPQWLRERDIPPNELVAARKVVQAERSDEVNATPLSDCLENTDPNAFTKRLDRTARSMKPPTTLERLQEHPIMAKICRASLEGILREESIAENLTSSSSAG